MEWLHAVFNSDIFLCDFCASREGHYRVRVGVALFCHNRKSQIFSSLRRHDPLGHHLVPELNTEYMLFRLQRCCLWRTSWVILPLRFRKKILNLKVIIKNRKVQLISYSIWSLYCIKLWRYYREGNWQDWRHVGWPKVQSLPVSAGFVEKKQRLIIILIKLRKLLKCVLWMIYMPNRCQWFHLNNLYV